MRESVSSTHAMPYITRLCAIWVKGGKEGAGTLHVSSKKVGTRLVYGLDEALSPL